MKLRYLVVRLLRIVQLPMPRSVAKRVARLEQFEKAEKQLREIFNHTSLVLESPGAWRIHPMPSQDDLHAYYRASYWATRGDIDISLKPRDIGQFQYLRSYLDGIELPIRKAVNFGSGHGGISFLIDAAGFEVVNVDLHVSPSLNQGAVATLDDVRCPVSLVCASHSLEHVTNLGVFWSQVNRVLVESGVIFVEVPNSQYRAYSESIGNSILPKIHPPHTYYLTEEYFRSLELEIIDLSIYRYEGNPYGELAPSTDQGEVIRFIARRRESLLLS